MDYYAYMVKTKRTTPGTTLTLAIYKIYDDDLQQDLTHNRATKFNRHYSSYSINYVDGKTLNDKEKQNVYYVQMDTNYMLLDYLERLSKDYMKSYVTDFETTYNITTRPSKAALGELTSYRGLRCYHVVEQHNCDWLHILDEFYEDYDTDSKPKRRTTTAVHNYYGVYENKGTVTINNTVKNKHDHTEATTSDEDDDTKDDTK